MSLQCSALSSRSRPRLPFTPVFGSLVVHFLVVRSLVVRSSNHQRRRLLHVAPKEAFET